MKDRIRKILEYANLSQQDFATRLGISPASLSSIFTGRTKPTNNHVMAVHHAFPEINVNWLMFGEGEMLTSEKPESSSAIEVGSDVEMQLDLSETGLFSENLSQENTLNSGIHKNEPPVSSPMNRPEVRPNPATPRREAYNMPRNGGYSSQNAIIIDKDTRKIKEIRVFFSDGTYESFVPSGK